MNVAGRTFRLKSAMLAVPAVAALLALQSCEFSVSTAEIVETELSGVTPSDTVVGDSLPATVTMLHCRTVLAHAPSGTRVRGRWTVVRAETFDGQMIGEADLTVGESDEVVDFTLKPTEGLPPGRYKIDLFINPRSDGKSKPDLTREFSIVSSGPSIWQTILSTDPTKGTTQTEFSTDTDVLYCHAVVADPGPGTKVEAVWKNGDGSVIDRAPYVLKAGEKSTTFSLTLTGGLPAGVYSVDLYLNDAHVKSIPFTSR